MFEPLTHNGPDVPMECCGRDAFGSCWICPTCERQDCLQCSDDVKIVCRQCDEHVCNYCNVNGTCIDCVETATFHVKRTEDFTGSHWGVFDQSNENYGSFAEESHADSWRRYLMGEIDSPERQPIHEEK